jgi:hypothetical protein
VKQQSKELIDSFNTMQIEQSLKQAKISLDKVSLAQET